MIGQTISHYKILEKLGEGGMGVVYKAQDTKLDRTVALKFLPPEYTRDPDAKQRFVQEAKAASALDHPNICTIHETDETPDGQVFIAMAYYEGETLQQQIVNRQLSIDNCIAYAIQTAEGLQAAHKKGITHRDIKSSNIMVTAEGQVKIMDFGLAKTTGVTMLTKSGATVGTVPYMSPEQARGEKVDHRTDIWSLGVVLYELISGRLPFQSPYSEAIVYSILNEEPKPFSLVRSDVPTELESIVKRCLRKNLSDRYQHVDELIVDLRRAKVVPGKEVPPQIIPRPTRFRWRNWYLIGGAALLIGLLLFIFLPSFTSRDEVIHSIAVLPFANTTGDPNAEYLSDGIAESIINSLSRLSQLRVLARSTVFRYKDKDVDPQKVGHELGVRAVLTGRLIQQGDNLTIRTELVNVGDGTALWGQQYNRKLADLFAVQEEIAKEISDKLRLKLTGVEKQQLAKRPTENLKAFQYYTQGRAYAQRRTREDLFTAINYYEKAIQEDQNYALAYAGLADAYSNLRLRGYIAPIEGRHKAEEAVRKAFTLDENLAEAHATLGEAYVYFAPYNFSQGDRELRRAIELSPSLAIAHLFLGSSLVRQGRFDESLEEHLKARELDPLSSTIARGVSLPYYHRRDYVRALEYLRQANELGPPFITSWEIEVYIRSGLFDEALAELEKAKRERKSDPILIFSTGMVYAAQGKRAESLQTIKELEEMSGASLSHAHWIAKIYAALNEKELALTWLERGLAAGAIGVFYKNEAVWDPLRGDPRFNDLLKKMGLQPLESDKGSNQPNIEKPKTEASPQWQNSIAVLPFKNISADKEQEYFCDGMTEQLITNLTNLPNVKVIARTSVMQFKNTDKTIQQIAQELGVAHVLEGSVRKSGNTIRVTAQLIKADDGFHLWAKDYDRQLKDIFVVQDDVSNAIVGALKVKLPGSPKHSMLATAPNNTEAYDLYLRGNFFLHKSDQASLNRALDYFQKSIGKDRSYAPPYAGIAYAYANLADAYLPPKDAYPKAKSAAVKALELDSTNAEARAALAFILGAYERDQLSSQREFRRAMEFNPNSADVLYLSTIYLATRTGSAEAIARADRAIALDPLNPFASRTKETALLYARQYDEVIEQRKRTVELDPNFFYSDSEVGLAYREKGMLKEALDEYMKVQKLMPGQPLFGLAALYARMGKQREARSILRDLINESKKRYVAPTGIAMVYIALGERDLAFAWLEQAYQAHDAWLHGLKTDVRYDPIRSDHRYAVLEKKMGLEK